MTESQSSKSGRSSGFHDVDRSGDANELVNYLDIAKNVPSIEIGKLHASEQMRISKGDRVLEIGCGTGDDSIRLSALVGETGSVTGVDFSDAMIAEARGRISNTSGNLTFEQGDAQELRFDDNYFDSARAERVFIHIEDPDKALGELIRVTKPGGRVVLMEPDLDTFAFDSRLPGWGRYVSEAVSALARNPAMGRSLRRRFIEAGISDPTVTPFVMAITDFELGKHLSMLDRLLLVMVENNIASRSEVAALEADLLHSHNEGTFALFGPYYVVTGIVPA